MTNTAADPVGKSRWGRQKACSLNTAEHVPSSLDDGDGKQLASVPADGGDASADKRWRRARGPTEVSQPTEPPPCNEVPPLTREGRQRAGLGCTIRMRRGMQLPQMGLGGGGLEGAEGTDAIVAALDAGYRLIDTALYYGTEKNIAAALRQSGVKRSDVFISTKLLQKAHKSNDEVMASLKESLRNLQTDYVDLYLIHNPRAGRIIDIWTLMLQIREQGLARSVGVSNFGVGQLDGIRQAGLEMPEVNQIEVHCWRQLPEVVEYHQKHGIVTMCMAPLARCRMMGKSDLAVLAKELKRSEAEIAIRWSLQNGYVPIPKSINHARIIENTAEGFDLSQKHMDKIKQLDSGFMSCTMASPCHTMDWQAVAHSIPHPDTWGGGRNSGKGKGGKGYSGKGAEGGSSTSYASTYGW